MKQSEIRDIPVLQSELLSGQPALTHFFTLRGETEVGNPYSQWNLCDYSGDDPVHVTACRQAVADALGIPIDRMWFPRQVHGDVIAVVDAATPPALEVDGVITRERNLLIGVSTADCVPVLLYDPETGTIAAVHAGWRGTVKHIVKKAVTRMLDVTGGNAADIYAALGPSISPAAFEVGEEVAEAFVAADRAGCVYRDGYVKPHVDLWQSNVEDLLEAGLQLDRIDCTPFCTWQNSDRLFSARRIGVKSGRIASCLLVKPEYNKS
jgi:hypothetical protein